MRDMFFPAEIPRAKALHVITSLSLPYFRRGVSPPLCLTWSQLVVPTVSPAPRHTLTSSSIHSEIKCSQPNGHVRHALCDFGGFMVPKLR